MIGIYTENTKGIRKKFTLSFAIKFFTYWFLDEFKKRHPEFSNMKMKDIPTHSLIGYDQGLTGEKIIFESSKTQQLFPYYECRYEFEFSDGNDINLFWKIVKPSIGDWYGIFQLWYFVKTWFWKTFFPESFIRLWSKLFHGGKDILQWGNPFVWFKICTEQVYNYMQDKSNTKSFPYTTDELQRANSNNIFPLLLLDMCLNIHKRKELSLTINKK